MSEQCSVCYCAAQGVVDRHPICDHHRTHTPGPCPGCRDLQAEVHDAREARANWVRDLQTEADRWDAYILHAQLHDREEWVASLLRVALAALRMHSRLTEGRA